MKIPSLSVLVTCSFVFATRADNGSQLKQRNLQPLNVFINEIHYDDTGVDEGEAVEVAFATGADVSGYKIELYNGEDGTRYRQFFFENAVDCGDSNGLTFCRLDGGRIENGSRDNGDGLALVAPGKTVLQFLSYEGVITATTGAAKGMNSTDIGVRETQVSEGYSLQLGGTGCSYDDFFWQEASQNTFGDVNTGQSIDCGNIEPPPLTSPPTASPTEPPTPSPTALPTESPTPSPTREPTVAPTGPPTASPTSAPTPSPTQSVTLNYIGEKPSVPTAFPLGQCEADCDGDNQCNYGLSCFQRRSAHKTVPGCVGDTEEGKDYCFVPFSDGLVLVDNAFPLRECQGECFGHNDCDVGLSCSLYRTASELVPGCRGEGAKGRKYCYRDVPAPPSNPAPLAHLGERDNARTLFPLGVCESHCDGDIDCQYGLSCFERGSNNMVVPGCSGTPEGSWNYCSVPPPDRLVIVGEDNVPPSVFPLQACQGSCANDNDCGPGLVCSLYRTDVEAVPGCFGEGVPSKRYCYDPTLTPTLQPTQEIQKILTPPPTNSPTDPIPADVTYRPGEPGVIDKGLLLSTGLQAEIIAKKFQKVKFFDGGESDDDFHKAPDGAAVFEDKDTGGWLYVSNSEHNTDGGVGAIRFDSSGRVVGYERIASGTRRNCGGGKMFWNTWLTCEETTGGFVWEVDPWGVMPKRKTLIGGPAGDKYESAAYDNRNESNPIFYVTTDRSEGPVVKYTPDVAAVQIAVSTGNYTDLLHTNQTQTAKNEYLLLHPDDPAVATAGSFSWTQDLSVAEINANTYYENPEGIDIRDGMVYITCKDPKLLIVLDVDNMRYTSESTVTGAFDNQPDQVARILGGNHDDILYFCEDGGKFNNGVHGRDSDGRFFTILENAGIEDDRFKGESTGLAFSPDRMHMYVSYQSPGLIFDITRTDGYPFGGQRLDIKYHAPDNVFALP